MKNLLIIGLLSLAFLIGQETFAQTTAVENLTVPNQIRPNVTGLMIRKFKKKKHSSSGVFTARRTRYSTNTLKLDSFLFDSVNYNPDLQEWRLFGDASDSGTGKVVKLFLRYQEWNGLLEISMTRERNVMWRIPKTNKIQVTIPEDKSSFRLDFIDTIEGIDPAGSNYFWIQGSWLLAPR